MDGLTVSPSCPNDSPIWGIRMHGFRFPLLSLQLPANKTRTIPIVESKFQIHHSLLRNFIKTIPNGAMYALIVLPSFWLSRSARQTSVSKSCWLRLNAMLEEATLDALLSYSELFTASSRDCCLSDTTPQLMLAQSLCIMWSQTDSGNPRFTRHACNKFRWLTFALLLFTKAFTGDESNKGHKFVI